MISVDDILKEFGDRVVSGVKENIVNSRGLANSNLAQSVKYTLNDDGVIFDIAPYYIYAEKGRDKGGTPHNFIEILIDWMHRYNINPKYGTERSFAWAIKKKTEKEGSAIWRGEYPPRDFKIEEVIDTNMEWLETMLPRDLISSMKTL